MNKDFYPTPNSLINKMISYVDMREVKTILEPSAGQGHIIEKLLEDSYRRDTKISAIEIDNTNLNILHGKIKKSINEDRGCYNSKWCAVDVIDTDFLNYQGSSHFDLIIANFPFSEGEKHLSKALDVLFSGQLVCLVNAETIRNPCTNLRKEVVERLNQLDAKIEYIKDAFVDAERKTSVEVALIYLKVERTVEHTLYSTLHEETLEKVSININKEKDIVDQDQIKNLVSHYNQEREVIISQIVNFYENYHLVGSYLDIDVKGSKEDDEDKSLTSLVQSKVNQVVDKLKHRYWCQVTELDKAKKMLTKEKRYEFMMNIDLYKKMEFSEANIYRFFSNLSENLPSLMKKAVVRYFDEFTKYALLRKGEFSKNIHMYNGWKTNEAFKVAKKVILPFYSDFRWNDSFNLSWDQRDTLDDLDRIFGYFSLTSLENSSSEIVERAFKEGTNRNIETDYFILSFFKKGTMHITFKDERMLREFNIMAAKEKGWLPMDYGNNERYKDHDISKEFEGKYKGDTRNLIEAFSKNPLIAIEQGVA